MFISSKLNKLTSAKNQQPSLCNMQCMLLISFQFTKLLRYNHNYSLFSTAVLCMSLAGKD